MVDITKLNMISSTVHLLSLLGVIVRLAVSSMNVTIISLLAFCFFGNLSTVTGINMQLQKAKIIEDLLREGVFDKVIDVPEHAVEILKL